MMTFLNYLAEMRMKTVAPGIAIPAPSKTPAPKPKPLKPLVPAAKPKAPAAEPLTLGQALEKSAQITVLAKFADAQLRQNQARDAVGEDSGKTWKPPSP